MDLSKFIDLRNPGWCTPTILVAVFALLTIITMTLQLAFYRPHDEVDNNGRVVKKDNGRAGIINAMLIKTFWALVIGGLLYWLCSSGKTDTAWWVFGALYILPVALMLVILSATLFAGKGKQ